MITLWNWNTDPTSVAPLLPSSPTTGIILRVGSANERRRYNVMSSLIGRVLPPHPLTLPQPLTNSIHLSYDDLTDLLGSADLGLLSQHATNHWAQDEQHTLASVHCIHMAGAGPRVASQTQHVRQELSQVTLQPHATHLSHKLHIGL